MGGQNRRSIATFDNYADAQRTVDLLSDEDFPVEHVAIVGHGLRYVEQVAGRMTTARAALMGALQGATIGAVFGLVVAIIFTLRPNPSAWLLVLYGIVAGGALGAVFGALTHAATGGERDFTSVRGMQAERFEVLVDEEVAGHALDILRSAGMPVGSGSGSTIGAGSPPADTPHDAGSAPAPGPTPPET
jgi:hypothetical protein